MRKHEKKAKRVQKDAVRLAHRMLSHNPPFRCPRVDPHVQINRMATEALARSTYTDTVPSTTGATEDAMAMRHGDHKHEVEVGVPGGDTDVSSIIHGGHGAYTERERERERES